MMPVVATLGVTVASNTYSASLVTQFLLDGAITVLQHKWAALKVFSRDFSTDRYKPRASAQLKTVASADTTVQTNATKLLCIFAVIALAVREAENTLLQKSGLCRSTAR